MDDESIRCPECAALPVQVFRIGVERIACWCPAHHRWVVPFRDLDETDRWLVEHRGAMALVRDAA